MVRDAAAAGGERDRPPKLPPGPRLGPGSGAGATEWRDTPASCHGMSCFVMFPPCGGLSSARFRCLPVPPAGPGAGTLYRARSPARLRPGAGGRFAAARFARLIARACEAGAGRTSPVGSFGVFFAPARNGRSGAADTASSYPHSSTLRQNARTMHRIISLFTNKPRLSLHRARTCGRRGRGVRGSDSDGEDRHGHRIDRTDTQRAGTGLARPVVGRRLPPPR